MSYHLKLTGNALEDIEFLKKGGEKTLLIKLSKLSMVVFPTCRGPITAEWIFMTPLTYFQAA